MTKVMLRGSGKRFQRDARLMRKSHEHIERSRQRVGARGLSGFVARAIAHELEREQLGAFLIELDRRQGPLPRASLAAARRAWPKR